MIGLSQMVLQVGLCNPMTRVTPETTLALRVRMYDRVGNVDHDQTFRVLRGESDTKLLNFTTPPGFYVLKIDEPKYHCTAEDLLEILPDHDREVAETLSDGPARPPAQLLVSGTAPSSFLYAKPTFQMIDASTPCNAPIGDPIPANIVVENDQDGYYSWFYNDPTLAAHSPMYVAVKIGTPTGEHHYIRLKIPFPNQYKLETITFDITEDMMDEIAGNAPNTLLCLKLWKTSTN